MKQFVFFVYIICFLFSHLFLYGGNAHANTVIDDVLTISNSKAWKPFSYLENGKPKGLLIDFWLHYSEVTGQKVKFELTDWQDSLDNVSNGKAMLHAGLLYSAKRDKLLDFGSSVFSLKASLYVNRNLIQTFDNIAELKIPIGVVLGGYEQEYLQKNYPNITLIGFPNNGLLFDAIASNSLESFVTDSQVANFYLISQSNENKYIPYQVLYEKPIRLAVKSGDQALLDFVENGIANVSRSDINRIQQKWINTETTLPDWLHQTLFWGIAFLILSYIYMLKKLVKRRTSALALVNEKLQQQANSDPLTALFNRRYFVEHAEREFNRPQRHKSNLALMSIDIDYFKNINDKHGHPAGDKILIEVSKCLSSYIRNEDILARIGGEEFSILLPETTLQAAKEVAERIKLGQSQLSLTGYWQGEINVTVSIGISCLRVDDQNFEQLFSRTDKALYIAKDLGRNTVYFLE